MARDPLQRDGKAWANALRQIRTSAELGEKLGRVAVELGSHHSRGLRALPPEIATVPGLVTLLLKGAAFRDVSALHLLPQLEELAIDLGSPLPPEALYGLPQLRALYLTGDGGLDAFHGQSRLKALRLERSARRDLRDLPELPDLESLWLWSLPGLNSLDGIERAPALRSLLLLECHPADIGALAGLTGLRHLTAQNLPLTRITPLAGLVEMESLDLSGTRLSDLSPLAGMTGLRDLMLSGGAIHALAPLSGLGQLEQLSLRDCPVSDLSPLAGMPQLRRLSLRGTAAEDLSPLVGLVRLGLPDPAGGLDLEETPAAAADPLLRRNLWAADQAAETARIFARVQEVFG